MQPPTQSQTASATRTDLVVIVLAIFVAFGRLVNAEFSSWDDQHNIAHNPHFNPPTLAGVAHYWAHPAYSLYIPVTYTVWGALAAASYLQTPDPSGSHLNPLVFHGANLLVHAVTACLVYRVLARLIRSRGGALVGALLFALHPVQVESVGWAAGMKDVLLGMFSLLAILQYVRFVDSGSKPRYALATTALLLGMLAKPTAMVVPAMAFAIDWLLLERPAKTILRTLWPWLVLSVGCAIVARGVQSGFGIEAPPPWARPLIALDSLTFYLGKLAWPVNLGIDYGRRPSVVLASGVIYWTWAIPAVIAILLGLRRPAQPTLRAAALLFVIALAPLLGLVPFLFQYYSTTADHYLYLAMLGPALAAAWVVQRYGRPLLYLGAAAVLVALGMLTMRQTAFWQDDLALFSHAIAVNPSSFMAHGNLGNTYLNRGDLDPAERHLRRAIELKPDYWESEQNLAEVYSRRGDSAAAIPHRKRAMQVLLDRDKRIRADIAPVLNALAYDLIQAGQLDEAAVVLKEVLTLRPDNPLALNSLRLLEEKRATTAPAGP